MGLLDWFAEALGFDAPSAIELIFITCAVLGAAFFIIMMGLMLIGDILGGVVDTAFDTDFSLDTDLSFELFSLQGIAAAIMMFGLMGLFTVSATGMELLAVVAGGFAAGGSLFMVRVMMQGITNLQADGTMRHTDAIGEKGHVYSRILPNATGEVQVAVDGTLRTLTARAKDKTASIPSNELIIVVDVIGATMIVEPLNSGDEIITEEE
ncbi:NfeD family protein [bacterium]|jgi:membrane protein implicated in regulation of membrane protease activity|nr:NfeD family protein [bacterium]